MFLLVNADGSRWWQFRYRRPGTRKENLLSLGTYPDISLKRAREKRDEPRKLLADGIDPADKRKAEAQAGAESFEALAREWFAKFSTRWAASHADKIIRRLERDVFPWIGSKPIAALTAPDVLAVLRRIEARGAIETAHRAHQRGQMQPIRRHARQPVEQRARSDFRHDAAALRRRRRDDPCAHPGCLGAQGQHDRAA